MRRACRGAEVVEGRQFCRAELERFRKIAAGGEPIIGRLHAGSAAVRRGRRRDRGQRRDRFRQYPRDRRLVEGRQGGRPEDGGADRRRGRAGAGLPFVSLTSEGVTLIYGSDERAIEAADLLKDHLDVTVLIKPPADVAPPRVTEFPVVKGTIRAAKGHLGAFELTVDDYAAPQPSSRGALSFGPARNGAVSRCDILIDLSGGAPLFPGRRSARRLSARRSGRSGGGAARGAQGARSHRHFRQAALHHLHRGSVRAFALEDRRLPPLPRSLPDRRDRAQRRSRRHRRADLRRLRPMRRRLPDRRRGLRAAAGRRADAQAAHAARRPIAKPAASSAVVLFHDDEHGGALIDALARHGDGLPANVLPLQVNEVTQVGLEAVAAALPMAHRRCASCCAPSRATTWPASPRPSRWREPILAGLGFAGARVATIETDDPDALGDDACARLRRWTARPSPRPSPPSAASAT